MIFVSALFVFDLGAPCAAIWFFLLAHLRTLFSLLGHVYGTIAWGLGLACNGLEFGWKVGFLECYSGWLWGSLSVAMTGLTIALRRLLRRGKLGFLSK